MNREEIKQVLPHREPMLLVDWTERQEDGGLVLVQGVLPHVARIPPVLEVLDEGEGD